MNSPTYESAWIFGSSGGIGQALSRAAKDCSQYSVLIDRTQNSAEEDKGFATLSYEMDASISSNYRDFEEFAMNVAPPPQLLIIAAGHVSNARVEDVQEAELNAIVQNNFSLAVLAARSFYKCAEPSRDVRKLILIIGSNAAEEARPNQPIYAATKAAIRHLIQSLAVSWCDRGIAVVGVEPGTVIVARNKQRIDTTYPLAPIDESRPSGLLLTPDDIVETSIPVLRSYGRHFTGRTLVLDGGSSLRPFAAHGRAK